MADYIKVESLCDAYDLINKCYCFNCRCFIAPHTCCRNENFFVTPFASCKAWGQASLQHKQDNIEILDDIIFEHAGLKKSDYHKIDETMDILLKEVGFKKGRD